MWMGRLSRVAREGRELLARVGMGMGWFGSFFTCYCCLLCDRLRSFDWSDGTPGWYNGLGDDS